MDPKKPGSIRQRCSHLRSQILEPRKPTACSHHALCPGKRIGNLDECTEQMGIGLRLLDTWRRSIAGANVSIGVTSNEMRIRKG